MQDRKTYDIVNRQLDKIMQFLENKPSQIKRGGGVTEPYNSYKHMMDNLFRYFNIVQAEKEANEEKYATSISDLDKQCDCEKYKCKGEQNLAQPDSSGLLFEEDVDTDTEYQDKDTDYTENTEEEKMLVRKEGLIE